VHQVGDQPRLYYEAWSTNHQDLFCNIYSYVRVFYHAVKFNKYLHSLKVPTATLQSLTKDGVRYLIVPKMMVLLFCLA